MNKRTIKSDWVNIYSVLHASLAMIILGLLVTWGLELMMHALFRLG